MTFNSMYTHVDRREWLWVLVAGGLVLLVGSIPYLVARSAQTPQQIFSGSVFDRQDYSVHLAAMQLGARGEWAYRLRFTTEPQNGAYIKLFYIFLGHFARWFRLEPGLVYHLTRWLAGLSASIAIYGLFACLFQAIPWRRLATLLALLGSGLGWLQLITGWIPQADISPIDFWLIDASVFFGFQIFPHFAAVTGLLAGMLWAFLWYLDRPSWPRWAVVALTGLALQFIQPYAPALSDLALLGIVAGLGIRQRRFPTREAIALLAICAVQIPLLAYNLYVLQVDPVWRGFAAQNLTLSPPPSYYLWGFGLFWPFALMGVWHGIKTRNPLMIGALFWVTGALLMAYLPTGLQRRFVHGLTIPLAMLAMPGLRDVFLPWISSLSKRKPTRLPSPGTPLLPASEHNRSNLSLSGARGAKSNGPLPRTRCFTFRRRSPLNASAESVQFTEPDQIGDQEPTKPTTSVLTATGWALLLVALASISSVYLSLGRSLYLLQRPAAYFDPVNLVQAVDWLSETARPDEAVLSTELTGQLAAARGGLLVYLGHPMETLDYERKTHMLEQFYRGNLAISSLSPDCCPWVIAGPQENPAGEPAMDKDQLELAYNQGDVWVYRMAP